jgi:hypothetical protein
VFKSFEGWARVHEDRTPTHGYAATHEAEGVREELAAGMKKKSDM